MATELDIAANLPNNYADFDTHNIQQILLCAKSDYALRKQCLEQLAMLLPDPSKRGKLLFTNQGQICECFTFVLQEMLSAYQTAHAVCENVLSDLPSDQIAYLEQCLKFVTSSALFFADEPLVKAWFECLRQY